MSEDMLPSRRPAALDRSEDVPDAVVKFVHLLHKAISNRVLHEVQSAYDLDYNKLNDRFFKASSWPTGEAIAVHCERNENTILLYKEMFFRQSFSRTTPSVEERIDSFNNYINLFNIILGLKENEPEIELPSSWLWDMVEAFVDQFQSFHLLRSRTTEHNLQDQGVFSKSENEHVWSAQTVIVFLEAIIKKAQLSPVPSIVNPSTDEDLDDVIDGAEKKDGGPANMFTTLGHFASIGLARVQMLLCDYYGSIQALSTIDLMSRKEPHRRSLGATTSLYSTLVFSYFMLRRYIDCVKTGSYFLNYVSRNEFLIAKASLLRKEVIAKKIEQLHGLIAMAVSICPTYLEENIAQNISNQLGDRLSRMQKDNDLNAYDEVFCASCPSFVNPVTPDYSSAENPCTAALQLQVKIFLLDIKQRANLGDIYSYLHLCSTVSTAKLASFLKVDEDTLSGYFLNVKHKTRNLRWSGGPALDGKWKSQAQVDFVVNKDIVQVADSSTASKYGNYFIRQILKLEDTIKDIRARK